MSCYLSITNSLYSNQQSRVFTKTYSTGQFPFRKGVFQGDPLSPIIFLMVFNPIIEFLQSEAHHGYDLDGKKIITLPYADDFCLITTNKRTHQRLMNLIDSKIRSMGMKLKPVKCRTFSIKSGSPCDLVFSISNNLIPTIFHEEQKFLGKLLFPLGKSIDIFYFFKTEFSSRLENLNATLIRDEYKLWIYKHYFIPSIRFILTVHTVLKTDLKKLDVFTDKYIKKWSGIPRCATNAAIHLQTGLNIPSISELHSLSHSLAHARTRIQGDSTVNHALDVQLRRESQWSRKQSAIRNAEEQFSLATAGDQPHPPTFKQVKEKVKVNLCYENEEAWITHIQTLLKQGHFLLLATSEKTDMIWKSYMFNMKKGTLKFLMNACLDTLPTQVNLLQWGKVASDHCKLCVGAEPPLQGHRKGTLHHVLNHCNVSLHQGRFTWRHDSILKYICNSLDTLKCTFNADIPPFSLPGGGTIPPHLCVTPLKPDLVVTKGGEMHLFELTVPLEPNINSAHIRKSEKYAHFISDIESMRVYVQPFEIGSRGFISPENKTTLKLIHSFCKSTITFTTFIKNISTIAISSSYYIFINRNSTDWDSDIQNIGPSFQ